MFCTSFSRNKRPSVRCALAANEMIIIINMFENHFHNINLRVNLFNALLQHFLTVSVFTNYACGASTMQYNILYILCIHIRVYMYISSVLHFCNVSFICYLFLLTL
jgi:hypothetical protein